MSGREVKPTGAPAPVLVDVERLRDALRIVVRGELAGLRWGEMADLVGALELADGAVAEVMHEERMRWRSSAQGRRAPL